MTKDNYTGRCRLGLNSFFVPNTNLFQISLLSFCPNVNDQFLKSSIKLTEQEKNQRATAIKNRPSKQTFGKIVSRKL